MLNGRLKIQERISKEEVLNEIRKSERLICLKTYNRLFKRDRSQDSDLNYVINMHDVRNGMDCLKEENKKDMNLDTLIAILESEQPPHGLTDALFADFVPEYLVVEPGSGYPLTNREPDGLRYIFDDLKDPGKETIDLKQLTKLYNEFYFQENNKEPIYSEEQLKNMINATSIQGEEITYEDFRKLFSCKTF